MALFEFEDGHLVPAQFGYPVASELDPELVDAVCQQVLQIVSRPLFPVTWRDVTSDGEDAPPRLTALDVTGQVVSVEILQTLDSKTLIASLSRLAEIAALSWVDLANEYPSGPEGFRVGWNKFRESMPTAAGPGPRLIMVAAAIEPSVRPALDVLASSGVEVHAMSLRQMSNGRLFLDVDAVGPRLYGMHSPHLVGGGQDQIPQIGDRGADPAIAVLGESPYFGIEPALPSAVPVGAQRSGADQGTEYGDGALSAYASDAAGGADYGDYADEGAYPDGDDYEYDDYADGGAEEGAYPDGDGYDYGDGAAGGDGDPDPTVFSGPRTKPTPRLRAHGAVAYSTDEEPPAPFVPQGDEEGPLTDGGAMDAAVASSADVEADPPEVAAAREAGLPVLDRDEDGLRALGQILGEDVPLVARTDLRMPSDLALTGSGAIRCDGLTYPSIEILFNARGIGDYDGWNELYLGDRLGPTLAESLAEINREIMREYADAPAYRGPARH